MKKILSVLAVFAVGALAVGVGSASAFSLGGYVGPVEFKFTGLTESNDQGTWDNPPNGAIPNTGETWGVFKVTTIQKSDGSGDLLWQQNQDDEQIYGMIAGLYDWQIAGTPPNVEISQLGGEFVMYISTGNPSGDHSGEYDVLNLGPGGRDATLGYDTITDIAGSQLFLAGDFNPGAVIGDNITTVFQDVTSATSPATGNGFGYADLTGGDYMSLFDTDSKPDANNTMHDFQFAFAVLDGAPSGWDQIIDDPIRGSAVPVPPTMFLLGTGLAGLAGLRRKYNL